MLNSYHFRTFTLFLCLFDIVTAERCFGPRTPDELRHVLFGPGSNYTKRTRPNVASLAENPDANPADAEPEDVRVQMHILSMKDIDQQRSEFHMKVWFRQRWNDYRLQYLSRSEGGCLPDTKVGYTDADFEDIWHPDVVSNNVVDSPKRLAGSFWIFPNGDVVHSAFLLLEMSCRFDFASYPRDTQVCDVVIGTWREDASEAVLGFYDNMDVVTIARENDVGNSIAGSIEWEITDVDGVENPSFANGAMTAESNIVFQVHMKRNAEYYIDFVIVPVLLTVILSWSSFFIDRRAVPARTAMAIICFLTNTNFLAAQFRRLPHLGGNDVFLLRILTMSMFFTFYAVIEYVICNYLMRIQTRITKATTAYMQAKREYDESSAKTEASVVQEQPLAKNPTKEELRINGNVGNMELLLMKKNGEMIVADEKVENFSRWVYPFAYTLAFLALWFTHA